MNEAHYILLLQKKLTDEISPDEQRALDAWLQQSPDNETIAKSVRKAWELSESFTAEVELDADGDFRKIEQRIAAPDPRPAPVFRSLRRRQWFLRVAAVLILVIAGYYIFDKFTEPIVEYKIVRTDAAPSQTPVILVDGTTVWLNHDTKLSYFISTAGNERRVKVAGEAFFQVARDEEKPFIVETKSGEVTVLGTSFSVKERTRNLEVTVATGRVELSPKRSEATLVLTNNEKGIYRSKEKDLVKLPAPTLNELAWQNKKLVFENTPLKDALTTIGNHYKVSISLEKEALQDCPLTATFEDKKIDAVINTLELLLGAEAELKSQDNYLLKGGLCD